MQKDVARKHGGQPGQNLIGAPALTLEVDDVRLQKDRAAITEGRHRASGKGSLGITLDGNAEALRGGLQKITIAGRTLRVKPEIADATLTQQNQLDVLAANIDHHMRIGHIAQGGFGVRHGFGQSHVGAEYLLQNVLGVAGGSHAKNLQAGAGVHFHLAAKTTKNLDGIRNRVSLGEAIGLDQHLAALREKHRLGGRGTAIETDKGLDVLAALKWGRNELSGLVAGFEGLQFLRRSA